MKINIYLGEKSIRDAIKKIEAVKNKSPQMQQEFINQVAKWVVERANMHLKNSDIGSAVKSEIISSWKYEPTTNGIRAINKAEKAVYVEFGVGIVGQGSPHPNASVEGYEYNMPSPNKYAGKYHDNDTWRFIKQSTKDVDLPKDSYETWQMGSGNLKIITRGTKGAWYAYNAIVDARMELAKTNGGEIGKMWEGIKARYIK